MKVSERKEYSKIESENTLYRRPCNFKLEAWTVHTTSGEPVPPLGYFCLK